MTGTIRTRLGAPVVASLTRMSEHAGPVLVIGATGQQGGAVVRALAGRGRAVRAFVRDPDAPAAQELRRVGAELVTGNLDDHASVRAALRGADAMFLMLTMMTGPHVTAAGVEAEVRRGLAAAELAAEAGVGHLVYSSVASAAEDTGIPHVQSKGRIEERIRALGLRATVLRPTFFMENFATHTRPVVVGGELVVTLGLDPGTPLQLVSTVDVGEVAALAFEQPERFRGRQWVLAGDELTGAAIAERFGRARGLPARFERVPIERLRAFDPEVARMFEWFDSGRGERADIPALRAVHPGLLTLESWLRVAGGVPA